MIRILDQIISQIVAYRYHHLKKKKVGLLGFIFHLNFFFKLKSKLQCTPKRFFLY